MFQTKFMEKNTHFMFNNFFQNRAIYEIMWKNVLRVGQATDDSIIQCMCFACWITKATDIHSEYVIRIAFPW